MTWSGGAATRSPTIVRSNFQCQTHAAPQADHIDAIWGLKENASSNGNDREVNSASGAGGAITLVSKDLPHQCVCRIASSNVDTGSLSMSSAASWKLGKYVALVAVVVPFAA